MNLPVPYGAAFNLFARLLSAIRENPCRIEIITGIGGDQRQWIRIRNDTNQPVQLFEVSFRWKLKGSSKFDQFHTPFVWILSDHTKSSLAPAHSFEHPVDAHELGKPVAECEISVRHNRSRYEEKKRFKVRD